MAKHVVLKDDTSRIEYVFIQDSSVTTGAGLTGLVFNSASLVASYARTAGARVAITLATQTVTGAFSSGGFVEVDATNMPGVYRVDVPDAAFATGVDKVVGNRKGKRTLGFGANIKSKDEENLSSLMLQVEPEDLVKFGMIPEFIGRLPILASLTELDEAALIDVLTGHKGDGG